jgi:thiamine-monophosphate kinase
VLADIVLLGSAPRGKELRRSGARPGHDIFVTGTLGGAAAELAALAARPRRFRRAVDDGSHPHLFPAPRLDAGRRLRRIASAAMDLSDGLSTDLRHLCTESSVGAIIEASALPLHTLAASSGEALALALHGGEDYELLFTAPAQARVPGQVGGVSITRIGRVTADRAILLRQDGQETPLTAGGWEHRI